mmetsp:Transcript_42897/g.80529  ORF Transcript_42897/g.80529 Transcript_42897/m.80529 type:complete len:201 (+) Transcript_42897:557-1159(+)
MTTGAGPSVLHALRAAKQASRDDSLMAAKISLIAWEVPPSKSNEKFPERFSTSSFIAWGHFMSLKSAHSISSLFFGNHGISGSRSQSLEYHDRIGIRKTSGTRPSLLLNRTGRIRTPNFTQTSKIWRNLAMQSSGLPFLRVHMSWFPGVKHTTSKPAKNIFRELRRTSISSEMSPGKMSTLNMPFVFLGMCLSNHAMFAL